MATVISEALRALIGVESEPTVTEVERSWLKHFAQSIYWPGEPNPLYVDEAHARKAGYRDIIAAPTFATRIRWGRSLHEKVAAALPEATVQMNGGSRYEFLRPIYPGDVLTGRGALAEVTESQRPDGGVLLIVKMSGWVDNQDGERVLMTGSTGLRIFGPDKLRG